MTARACFAATAEFRDDGGRVMRQVYVANVRTRKDGEYIGRPSRGRKGSSLANPFAIDRDGSRAEVIEKYRAWLRGKIEANDPAVVNELTRLAEIADSADGLTLLCWCAPDACHGDEIVRALHGISLDRATPDTPGIEAS